MVVFVVFHRSCLQGWSSFFSEAEDKNPDDPLAASRFIQITKAYQALTDPQLWGFVLCLAASTASFFL